MVRRLRMSASVQIQELGQVGGNKLVGGLRVVQCLPILCCVRRLLSIRLLAGHRISLGRAGCCRPWRSWPESPRFGRRWCPGWPPPCCRRSAAPPPFPGICRSRGSWICQSRTSSGTNAATPNQCQQEQGAHQNGAVRPPVRLLLDHTLSLFCLPWLAHLTQEISSAALPRDWVIYRRRA